MPHLDEGTIHAWLEGGLSPSEAALTEEHIAGCDECSAAVAEARGLIAASSRILTALDDVPSGVVPARAPRPKPWYVRREFQAAAALLLVAGTTLVLIQGGQQKQITASRGALTAADVAADTGVPAPAEAAASEPVRTGTVGSELDKREVAPKKSVDAVATKPAAVEGRISAAPAKSREELFEKSEARRATEPTMSDAARRRFDAAAAVAGAVTNAPPPKAMSLAAVPPTLVDTPIRIVSVERRIGGNRTTYEMASGVRVVLQEQMTTQLEEVVVSSAPQRQQAQKSGASIARPEPIREAKTDSISRARDTITIPPKAPTAAADTTHAAAAPPPPAFGASAMLRGKSAETNSIEWVDPKTKTRYTLSGPLTREQLEWVKAHLSEAKR